VLRQEDQVTGSGVLQWLSPGLRLPLRDLAELMIACSDNAATNMLLRRLGTEPVNACLDGLGLRRTRVRRPLQVVPAGGGEPNTVTAAEMAALLLGIARAQVVSFEACRRMVATLKRTQAADALPALLPPPGGAVVGAPPRWELAHKTGSIAGCEHDVGLLYVAGQTVAVAVLSCGCGAAREARAAIAEVGAAVYVACTGGLSGPPA
jgi:beta-lactamase class A